MFKRKYKVKLEFPEGWGFKPIKKHTVCGRGMDIFWNNTIHSLYGIFFKVVVTRAVCLRVRVSIRQLQLAGIQSGGKGES